MVWISCEFRPKYLLVVNFQGQHDRCFDNLKQFLEGHYREGMNNSWELSENARPKTNKKYVVIFYCTSKNDNNISLTCDCAMHVNKSRNNYSGRRVNWGHRMNVFFGIKASIMMPTWSVKKESNNFILCVNRVLGLLWANDFQFSSWSGKTWHAGFE